MARRMIFKSFVFPILILCCHRVNDNEWFSSWFLFTDCRFGNTRRSLPSLFTSLHDQVRLETKSSVKNMPIGHFIKTFSIAKSPWMNRSTSLEMSRVSQKLYNLHHGLPLFSIDLWSTPSLDSLNTFQERQPCWVTSILFFVHHDLWKKSSRDLMASCFDAFSRHPLFPWIDAVQDRMRLQSTKVLFL